jgi:voltage-gated potassium channel
MIFFVKWLLKIARLSNAFLFGFAAVFIVLSSLAAYGLEPETFGNPFNALWWVMTTVTTVGYGDLYPHTVAGKVLGMFLFIFGIGLISLTISKVIDALFVYQRLKEEGKLRFAKEGHFVIVDWSKHAELAVQEIMNTDPSAEIVLIDELERTPLVHEQVHYVRGSPIQRETLEAASVGKARAVFIFANEVSQYNNLIRDTSFIDGKTLLIATAIERNFDVYTIVEIKDRDNLDNFRHVKINEFIIGSEAVSQLAVRAAFHPGATHLLSQLLSHRFGDDLYQIAKRPHWSTYRDAFLDLLQQGATLVSDGHRMDINRRLDERISDGAKLFVICDNDTYRKLAAV